MSSVEGESKTLLDTTANYVSSRIFGPMNDIDDGDDNTVDDVSRNDEDEADDESTMSDVVRSPDIQNVSSKAERGVNITRKGSLHVIASTLAKIANVKSTKGRSGKDGVLDGTVENQFESLLDVNDPDAMDHIVVDDGKQISIHTIRKASAAQVEESKEKLQETINIDPSTKQHDVENMNDDDEPTVLDDVSEKSLLIDQPSSFADCICPFTSSYPETEQKSPNGPTKEDATPFDEVIPRPVVAESTVNLKGNNEDVNAPDEVVPEASQPEIQAAQFDVDTSKETDQVESNRIATNVTNLESTAENSILEETPVTRPFSFLSYVIPLSPIPSLNHNGDVAEDGNQITTNELEESNLEGNDKCGDSEVVVQDSDTCTSKPINPPAKWSIFSPFVTSYVDSNRNTDIYGKDPVGNQLTVKHENSGEDDDVENGVDPIGSGPILFTNSIDKSITPPWDREDPPTTTNSSTSTSPTSNTTNLFASTSIATTDLETPVSNDQNEPITSQDVEDIEDLDDVECTMKGPVERIVPVLSAPNAKLTETSSSSTTPKAAKSFKGKYSRCRRIVVLLLLLLGALSAGVYYIIQNQSKNSSRVVAASQVENSANSDNQDTTTAATTKTSAPITSPFKIPTEAPLKNIVLRPTNAPSKRPIVSPTNQPSSISSDDGSTLNDDVVDDDVNASDGGDDTNDTDDDSVGDDDGNTDDDA